MDVLSAYASRDKNLDGSYTTTISGGKVWYQEAGLWLPVDITNSKQSGGSIVYRKLPDGTVVTFAESTLSYTMEKDGYYLSWIGPAATFVDCVGNVVRYVLAGGEAFNFLLTRTGVMALTKIAKDLDAAPTWKMDWDPRLTPVLDKAGKLAYVFKDQDGNVKFRLNQPVIYASDMDSELRSGDVVVDKNTGDLTVVLSQAGLTKPFLVDPTSTFNSSTSDFHQDCHSATDWATAQSGAGTLDAVQSGVTTTRNGQTGNVPFAPDWYATISGLYFDLSSILASSTVTSSIWKIFPNTITNTSVNSATMRHYFTPATYPDPMVSSQANFVKWTATDLGSALFTALATGSYQSVSASASGVAHIQTKLGLAMVIGSVTSAMFTSTAPDVNDDVGITWQSASGANPPQVSVTFTTASGGGAGGPGAMMRRIG